MKQVNLVEDSHYKSRVKLQLTYNYQFCCFMANRIFYTIFNLIFKNYTISYELRSSWTNQTFLWRIKEISPNLRLIIYFNSRYSVAASTSQRDFFPASNFDQNQNPVRRVLTSHFFVSKHGFAIDFLPARPFNNKITRKE